MEEKEKFIKKVSYLDKLLKYDSSKSKAVANKIKHEKYGNELTKCVQACLKKFEEFSEPINNFNKSQRQNLKQQLTVKSEPIEEKLCKLQMLINHSSGYIERCQYGVKQCKQLLEYDQILCDWSNNLYNLDSLRNELANDPNKTYLAQTSAMFKSNQERLHQYKHQSSIFNFLYKLDNNSSQLLLNNVVRRVWTSMKEKLQTVLDSNIEQVEFKDVDDEDSYTLFYLSFEYEQYDEMMDYFNSNIEMFHQPTITNIYVLGVVAFQCFLLSYFSDALKLITLVVNHCISVVGQDHLATIYAKLSKSIVNFKLKNYQQAVSDICTISELIDQSREFKNSVQEVCTALYLAGNLLYKYGKSSDKTCLAPGGKKPEDIAFSMLGNSLEIRNDFGNEERNEWFDMINSTSMLLNEYGKYDAAIKLLTNVYSQFQSEFYTKLQPKNYITALAEQFIDCEDVDKMIAKIKPLLPKPVPIDERMGCTLRELVISYTLKSCLLSAKTIGDYYNACNNMSKQFYLNMYETINTKSPS